MKYFRIILLWLTLSLILGLIIKGTNSEIQENGFLLLFIILGLILGSIKVLLTYVGTKNKIKIFEEARKIYNGKININGETELIIKEKKVILDYKLEQIGTKISEYIIANVDLTDIEKSIIENCKNKPEIIERNKNIYAVIYSSWGYKGEKFKERIENKIQEINECVKKKTATNKQI